MTKPECFTIGACDFFCKPDKKEKCPLLINGIEELLSDMKDVDNIIMYGKKGRNQDE